MTNIVIASHAADRMEGGRATRDTASLPPRAAVAHIEHTERDFCRAIFGRVPFFGARRGVRTASRNPVHVTPPLNFSRPSRRPGSLSSSARIQFLAEQFRGEAPVHSESSFVAPASELHRTTGDKAACAEKLSIRSAKS